MGETDEFVPQSSHAEDETVQEPAAEESAVPSIDETAEPTSEQLSDGPVESGAVQPVAEPAVSEPDELDEISQSLSDEGDSDDAAQSAEGDDDVDSTAEHAIPAEDADTSADSFDDIAPPVAAATTTSHVPEPSAAAGQVPWWPFMVYLGAWVVLAAAAVWQLLQLPANQVVYESTAYVLTILGGLIMTAVGPLLILAVWLGTRANRVAQEREGLLTSALLKGALVTLSGAIIWWASLVIIDYLRLGRLL